MSGHGNIIYRYFVNSSNSSITCPNTSSASWIGWALVRSTPAIFSSSTGGMELPPEKRLIRIYMEMKGNYLYIALTNTAGGGKKAHFATTKGAGHGLGLLRVDEIVKRHGGYITRASEAEAFSTEVLLPQRAREKKKVKVQLASNFRHLISNCTFFVALCYDAAVRMKMQRFGGNGRPERGGQADEAKAA